MVVAKRETSGGWWVPTGLVRTLELMARTLLPELRGKVGFDYKLRQFLKGHQQDAVGAHYAWRQIFTEDDKSDLLRPDVRDAMQTHDPLAEFRRFADEVTPAGLIDKMMYVDLKTWLVDDILVKTDRASMAHGLETRTPFLDHRLVEFAAALPIDLKMKGLKKKYYFPIPELLKDNKITVGDVLSKPLPKDEKEEVWKLPPSSLKLVPFISEGGSWKDIPYEELPDRFRKIRNDALSILSRLSENQNHIIDE